MKRLTLHYLKLAHPDTMGTVSDLDYDASDTRKMSDSFHKYYDRSKDSDTQNHPAAYQIRGAEEAEWRLNIIEGSVSAKALLRKARKYDATATVFITALLIRAIYKDMSVHDRKKPVVINVPVNLRNDFDSKSTRNFFSLVDIKFDFSEGKDTLADIIKCAKECFIYSFNPKKKGEEENGGKHDKVSECRRSRAHCF